MPYAIHCETEDLAKQVLQIAHDVGLRWADGMDLTRETNWNGQDQCYNLARGFPGGVMQCSKSCYMRNGFTIVKAQDFIAVNERSNCMLCGVYCGPTDFHVSVCEDCKQSFT